MIKTALVASIIATTSIFSVVSDFQQSLPQPVCIEEDTRLTEVRKALKLLGKDQKFATPLYQSAVASSIDPLLWTCNIQCESEFKITAKSNKGYKGLGQTPQAAMKTGYELADLTYAACVYQEKVKIAKGDTKLAWALYKGGNNPAAKKEAEKVFVLHRKLKEQIKEANNG